MADGSNKLTLPAGQQIEIDAGAHRIIVARDRAGHVGVADERGAYLPPLSDTEGRQTLPMPIIENHAAYSDRGAAAIAMLQVI